MTQCTSTVTEGNKRMLREILGRRRKDRRALLEAAATCASWGWRVVPGIGPAPRSDTCRCGEQACSVPGAHPVDPPLLAATTDGRMVRWWWSRTPDAPLVLATGKQVAALSVPPRAGRCALERFAKLGVRVGPVISTPARFAFLVEPYELPELAELLDEHGLHRHGVVPPTLRFHGDGGFLPLPPSRTTGTATWVVPPAGADGGPVPGDGPWLPHVANLVRVLVDTCWSTATAPGPAR
jgi:hypothetical protein